MSFSDDLDTFTNAVKEEVERVNTRIDKLENPVPTQPTVLDGGSVVQTSGTVYDGGTP